MEREKLVQASELPNAIARTIDGLFIETANTIIEVDPIIRATMAAFPAASEQEVTALVFREVEKRGYGVFWNNAHHPSSRGNGT